MPRIELEEFIEINAKDAFNLAQNIERFPEFIPSLKEVKILSRNGNIVLSRWLGVAEVGPISRQITWEERDEWNEERLECKFELIAGDMKTYYGLWRFLEAEGGSRLKLELEYDIGIPMLGPFFHKVIHEKMIESCQSILRAVKLLAEGNSKTLG